MRTSRAAPVMASGKKTAAGRTEPACPRRTSRRRNTIASGTPPVKPPPRPKAAAGNERLAWARDEVQQEQPSTDEREAHQHRQHNAHDQRRRNSKGWTCHTPTAPDFRDRSSQLLYMR